MNIENGQFAGLSRALARTCPATTPGLTSEFSRVRVCPEDYDRPIFRLNGVRF
jgi:hypothetical protein